MTQAFTHIWVHVCVCVCVCVCACVFFRVHQPKGGSLHPCRRTPLLSGWTRKCFTHMSSVMIMSRKEGGEGEGRAAVLEVHDIIQGAAWHMWWVCTAGRGRGGGTTDLWAV